MAAVLYQGELMVVAARWHHQAVDYSSVWMDRQGAHAPGSLDTMFSKRI